MIKPLCGICGKELKDFGAIVISPPEHGNNDNRVDKYHVCIQCYDFHIYSILK